MKNMIKLPAIILGLMLLVTGTSQKVMAQDEDISLQSFYDELSPYGTWIQDSEYGYVWRPNVEQGEFRPYYTNGRWAMTEYGNTWISNYDWGWAPFHYGRWVYNRYSQWVWIPDTVWGPAWVSWRSGGGYYGWAPMGPGMNINVNFNIPSLWWVFVPQRNIYYNSFPRYYSRRNVVIINNTTIINNTYSRNNRIYYSGPRAQEIRRYTGRDVNVYSINRASRPGRASISGNRVDLYTPTRSSRPTSASAAPRTVVRGEGYATPRPERAGVGSRVPSTTPSTRESRGTGSAERPQTQQAVPQRDPSRVSEPAPSQRPERVERSAQPQTQPTPQPRQEQPQAQPQPRPQAQPRSQSQPQPQRVERTEQSRPSRSSSPSQGSTSRPTRGGRD